MIGEVGAELAEVVSFRTQMVVNDVENHGDAMRVACVDEALQSARAAITFLDRVEVDAVVPPVARAGKRRHGHQFNRGHAQIAQARKARKYGVECSLRRERADMQLIEDEIAPLDAVPVLIRPEERPGMKDCRGGMNAVGLPKRARIGEVVAVEAKEIALPFPSIGQFDLKGAS